MTSKSFSRKNLSRTDLAILEGGNPDRVNSYRVDIAQRLGLPAAILLGFLNACSKREADTDGWFPMDLSSIMKRTALSERIFEGARKSLADLDLIEYRRKGVPSKNFVRVNYRRVIDLYVSATSDDPEESIIRFPYEKLAEIIVPTSQDDPSQLVVPTSQDDPSQLERNPAYIGPVRTLSTDQSGRIVLTSEDSMSVSARARAIDIDIENIDKNTDSLYPDVQTETESSAPPDDESMAQSSYPQSTISAVEEILTPQPPAPDTLDRALDRVMAFGATHDQPKPEPDWSKKDLEKIRSIFMNGAHQESPVKIKGGYPSGLRNNVLVRPNKADLDALQSVPRARAMDLLRALKNYAKSWASKPPDDEQRKFIPRLKNWIEKDTWEEWINAEVVMPRSTIDIPANDLSPYMRMEEGRRRLQLQREREVS